MPNAKDFQRAIAGSAASVADIKDAPDRMSAFLCCLTGWIREADEASARTIWQVVKPGKELPPRSGASAGPAKQA